MKGSVKVISLLLLFFLCSKIFGQDDYVVSKSKPVKVASNDTIILATVSRSALPENKIEKYKRYYWFSKGKIQSNVGGFHGNLLHGGFELFKAENLLVKGIYKNGLKDGVWKAWDVNGRYIEITNWNEGVIDGELTSYYERGRKKGSTFFSMKRER
jgi:antitoxin component YwqK of YwqJK toxin-antitoxin module